MSQQNDLYTTNALDEIIRNELGDWCENFLNSEFNYHVLLTRRCSNLFESIYGDSLTTFFRNKLIITENGLLVKCEEIANKIVESYNSNSAFPTIGIADDLMVHGRSLNSFLEEFLNLVFSSPSLVNSNFSHNDLAIAKEKFIANISIYIFAVKKGPVLLKSEFQWNMKYKLAMREEEWRRFALVVASIIQSSDKPNTSFVLSGSLNFEEEALNSFWIKLKKLEKSDEKNNQAGFSFRSVSSEGRPTIYFLNDSVRYGVVPCIRVYRTNRGVLFIPYFFTDGITIETAQDIVHCVRNYLSSESQADHAKQIIPFIDVVDSLLNNEQDNNKSSVCFAPVYGQFVNLLVSQITLGLFFQELLKLTEFELEPVYDIEHISRNFGKKVYNHNAPNNEIDINNMLLDLTKIVWSKDVLEQIEKVISAPDQDTLAADFPSAKDTNHFEREVGNEIYELAVDHEKHARTIEDIYIGGGEVSTTVLNSTGERSVFDVVRNAWKRLDNSRSNYFSVFISSLPFFLDLMDRGRFSMKIRLMNTKTGSPLICSVIRTTELSMSILPKRLGQEMFYPFKQIAQLFHGERNFVDLVQCYVETLVNNSEFKSENREEFDMKREDIIEIASVISKNERIFSSIVNWNIGEI